MKKSFARVISLFIILCLAFVGTPMLAANAADSGPGLYTVSVSSSLRVRSGPGTGYSTVGLVYNGMILNVLETTSSGWGKIAYESGFGWISLEYAYLTADSDGNDVSTDQRSAIVETAKNEVGYKEGYNNYTKYGVWYSSVTHNSPWCAIFVCWCANQAGISEGIIPRFSYCETGINLFKALGVWHEKTGYVPESGDVIFFRSASASSASDHVGLVVSCDETKVYTIEGNSSDAVSERSYKLSDSYIVGYASPKYKAPSPTTAESSTTATTTSTETAETSTSVSTTTTATTTTETTETTVTTATTTSSAEELTEPTSAPLSGAPKQTATVTGRVVNVRSGAGTGYARIAAVQKGDVLEVTGSAVASDETVWYCVSVNGSVGYICGSYAILNEVRAQSEEESARETRMVLVTGSSVNIRASAGTQYERIGSAVRNQLLSCTGTAEVNGTTWYEVQISGKTGFISGDYSKIVSQVKVTGGVVNIRTGAGTAFSKITSAKKGSLFTLVGIERDSNGTVWYIIDVYGQKGYISGAYSTAV